MNEYTFFFNSKLSLFSWKMLFFYFWVSKTDEQMHKETDKFMLHPLTTAGLSAELENYSSDRAVLLKGHGNAKGSSLGGTIVTMLNAYMGPLEFMKKLLRFQYFIRTFIDDFGWLICGWFVLFSSDEAK